MRRMKEKKSEPVPPEPGNGEESAWKRRKAYSMVDHYIITHVKITSFSAGRPETPKGGKLIKFNESLCRV